MNTKISYGKMPLIIFGESEGNYNNAYHRTETRVRAIAEELDLGRAIMRDERHGVIRSHWDDQFANVLFNDGMEIVDYVNRIIYKDKEDKSNGAKTLTLPVSN